MIKVADEKIPVGDIPSVIDIVDAEKEDIPNILKLFQRQYGDGNIVLDVRKLGDFRNSSSDKLVVAYADNGFVGCMMLHISVSLKFDYVCRVSKFAVSDHYLNAKVVRMMLVWVENLASRRECRKVEFISNNCSGIGKYLRLAGYEDEMILFSKKI